MSASMQLISWAATRTTEAIVEHIADRLAAKVKVRVVAKIRRRTVAKPRKRGVPTT